MAEREVTHTGKDLEGDITKLCNPDELEWSPILKADAIVEIKLDLHRYYVNLDGSEVNIHVVDGPEGAYLRTNRDETENNNLDELPDC